VNYLQKIHKFEETYRKMLKAIIITKRVNITKRRILRNGMLTSTKANITRMLTIKIMATTATLKILRNRNSSK